MSQRATPTTPSPAAAAEVQVGTDLLLKLLPVLAITAGSMRSRDAHIRFWLGFVSSLAGFIAADVSPEETQVVLRAAGNALDGAALDVKQRIH